MTRPTEGLTRAEFDQLVDEGFSRPLRQKKTGGMRPEPLPDKVLTDLALDGAAPGLSKSAARFHGALRKILGTSQQTPSPESIEFLQKFDTAMKAVGKKHGLDLRDD